MGLSSSVIVLIIISCILSLAYAKILRRKNQVLKAALEDALHKKAEIGNFLSIFSKNLTAVEELDDSMNMTARYVADLINAKALCIFILEEGGAFRAAGISGAFPPLHKSPEYVLTKPRYILESLRREKIKLGEGIIGEVAKNREPLLIEDASADPRIKVIDSTIPIETLMAVPMIKEGQIIGVICAVNNRQNEKPFSPEQFSTLKFMAGEVLLAHNIVKVYANLSKQQRISQELEFARQLQASLLPKDFPEWDCFVIYAFSRSAKEVSGDFYDFVEIDRNRLLVVIGDACGKGIPACMLMAMARSFIRANVARFTSLYALMRELNDNLFRDSEDECFVTVACCLLDREECTVEYLRAGHTELLMNVSEHHLRKIFPNGTAMGLTPTGMADDFETLSFSFLPGMSLLLFTDGITEALNANEEEFGIERLGEFFTDSCKNKLSPNESIEKILYEVDRFSEEKQQEDDQTLVLIRHR